MAAELWASVPVGRGVYAMLYAPTPGPRHGQWRFDRGTADSSMYSQSVVPAKAGTSPTGVSFDKLRMSGITGLRTPVGRGKGEESGGVRV